MVFGEEQGDEPVRKWEQEAILMLCIDLDVCIKDLPCPSSPPSHNFRAIISLFEIR